MEMVTACRPCFAALFRQRNRISFLNSLNRAILTSSFFNGLSVSVGPEIY